MKKLNSDEIKKIENNILSVYADFCEKNNLKYYLAYGTLIGAARHKGFIPWDDDIDVIMQRQDYDKMQQILKEKGNHISQNIVLKTPYDKDYAYQYCKIIDTNTVVYEKNLKNKFKTSLWIDIFVYDKIPEDKKNQKAFQNKLNKMRKYYFYSIEKKYQGHSFPGLIKYNLIKFFVTPIYSIINQKVRIAKLADKYANSDSNTWFCSLFSEPNTKFIMSNEFEQTKIQFEGREYTTFKNYDKVLRDYYGDYMQLPDEDKRISHDMDAYLKE